MSSETRLGPLLDREEESGRLDEAWETASSGDPQLALVWGRRRVGKTFLLSHLRIGKARSVFFGATQQAESIELRRFAEACRRGMGDAALDLAGGGFQDWETALRFLVASARDEPLLVVLDEVPYLSRSTPGFASIVQSIWDHVPPGTKLMLVLTGSAVAVIEDMIGANGPLRGRPTLSLRMDPIALRAARVFLPALDASDYFRAYAACGGYPLHLLAWDPKESLDENLLRLAATSGGILLEDAASIMSEELPSTGGYLRILAAIGRGRTRASEIANDAGQRIAHPLSILIRAGFVRKETPVGSPKASRPLYAIDDPYLTYWFRVLYSDQAQIAAGQGAAVLARRREEWQNHLDWMFEEAAREHATALVRSGVLPSNLVTGRWWATSGTPCEVDVLGLQGTRRVLLGEAKWSSCPLGVSVLGSLRKKADLIPKVVDTPIFALWGRSGVDPAVLSQGALGFSLADILGTETHG